MKTEEELKKEIEEKQKEVNDYSENTFWGKEYRRDLKELQALLQQSHCFFELIENRINELSKIPDDDYENIVSANQSIDELERLKDKLIGEEK